MKPEFTLDWLGRFLDQVAQRWKITPLGQWHGQDAAILRHDIDLDLDAAVRLAEWEQARGIHASFFILLTTDCYNPFSVHSRMLLHRIQDCGGEIGLHFDPTLYDPNLLQAAVEFEARQLSSLIQQSVTSVALHCPHRLDPKPLFQGFVNAYDPRIFGPGCYMSDSSRRFRTQPEEFLRPPYGPVQILIHPIHFQEEEREYPYIFRQRAARWMRRVDYEHRAVNPNYRDQLPASLDFQLLGDCVGLVGVADRVEMTQ